MGCEMIMSYVGQGEGETTIRFGIQALLGASKMWLGIIKL